MSKTLRNLVVRQIALVDRGANQKAHITLMKRAPEGPPCPTCGADHALADHEDAMTDTEKAALEKRVAEAEAAVKASQEEVAALKKQTTIADPQIDPLRTDYEKTQEELRKTRDHLQKELDDATQQLKDSQAEVVKIHLQRRRERFIKRVQELKHLPGAPADDFAEILDKLETALSATQFAKVNSLLDSWDTLLEKNALFTELGVKALGDDVLMGAASRLDVLAKELAAKDKITYAKAYDRVLKDNPKLYRKYLAEQGGR